MTYALCVLAGLLIGGLAAWLIASARVTKSLTAKVEDSERRANLAEDRRDCYWFYVVTGCGATPRLQEPIKDPARFEWHEVTKVAHYYLSVDALTKPMQVREPGPDYRADLREE